MGGACSCCEGAVDLQVEDTKELRRAARDGDVGNMEALLERMDIDQINSGAGKAEAQEDEEGMTALHYAAAANFFAGCELLLQKGAQVNQGDKLRRRAVHFCVEKGFYTTLVLLIKNGADLNVQDKTGATPLMYAFLHGYKASVPWMLSLAEKHGGARINLNQLDGEGNSYATIAAMYGWMDTLQLLLPASQGDNSGMSAETLNVRNKAGETVLGWVLKFCASGSIEVDFTIGLVSQLLSLGVKAAAPAFKESIPPICLAAAIGDLELLDLISKAAGPDAYAAKDALKRSVLHYCAAKGHLEVIRLALETKLVSPSQLDSNKDTALSLAAMAGQDSSVELLLPLAIETTREDPKVDKTAAEIVLLQTNKQGTSILAQALRSGPLPKAQRMALDCLNKMRTPLLLTEARVNALKKVMGVTVVDKENIADTPLLLAIGSHQHAVVNHLLERGVDVNEANYLGVTPLMRCLQNASEETAPIDAAIFKMLLKAQVELNLDSQDMDRNPLFALCKSTSSSFAHLVVASLEEHLSNNKDKINWGITCGKTGRTLTMEASLHNNTFIVRRTLETPEKKELLGRRCLKGRTAIMYAAWGCSCEAMCILLNRGAHVKSKDMDGNPVLSYCLRLDKVESFLTAALLLRAGASPKDCVDCSGEGFLHRSVRYGATDFIRLWACVGGNMCLTCTTHPEADIVPTDLKYDYKADPAAIALLAPPKKLFQVSSSAGPGEDVEEYVDTFERIEEPFEAVEPETGNPEEATGGQPVAEALEEYLADWADGPAAIDTRGLSFYEGPGIPERLAWQDLGSKWWDVWFEADTVVAEDFSAELLDAMEFAEQRFHGSLPHHFAKRGKGPVCENSNRVHPEVDEELERRRKQEERDRAIEAGEIPWFTCQEPAVWPPKGGYQGFSKHTQELAREKAKVLLDRHASSSNAHKASLEADPYFDCSSGLPYSGVPLCLQADVTPMDDARVNDLVESIYGRLDGYNIKPEVPQQGADLRERNLRWWTKSLAPEAYPMKLGKWRNLSQLLEKAVKQARSRVAPRHPEAKPEPRKRTMLIGMPPLPTFPELDHTSALTYAVCLGRPACVKALLDCEMDARQLLLDIEDSFGHTPLDYAMQMLTREKQNAGLQAITDMILVRRPRFKQGLPADHNSMNPLCLAVVAYDLPRIAWMVCKCGASLNTSWMAASDVPTYQLGQWERLLGKATDICAPMHFAMVHRRMEIAKLLLKLGANVRQHTATFKDPMFSVREKRLKSVSVSRKKELLKRDSTPRLEKESLASSSLLRVSKPIQKGGGISPLHFAARYGCDDICLMLLSSGADAGGGKRKDDLTPIKEALDYLENNYKLRTKGADQHNYVSYLECAETKIPPMSSQALAFIQQKKAEEAMKTGAKIAVGMVTGVGGAGAMTMLTAKATGAALGGLLSVAKAAAGSLLAVSSNTWSHHDPAFRTAHLLLRHGAPLSYKQSRTMQIVKDLADNGTWTWVGGAVGAIVDKEWLWELEDVLNELCVKMKWDHVPCKEEAYEKRVEKYGAASKRLYAVFSAKTFQLAYAKMSAEQKEEQKRIYQAARDAARITTATFKIYSRLGRLAFAQQNQQQKQELLSGSQCQKRGAKFEEPLPAKDIPVAELDMSNEQAFLGQIQGTGLLEKSRSGVKVSSSGRKSFRGNIMLMANAPEFRVPLTKDELQAHQSNPLGSCGSDSAATLWDPSRGMVASPEAIESMTRTVKERIGHLRAEIKAAKAGKGSAKNGKEAKKKKKKKEDEEEEDEEKEDSEGGEEEGAEEETEEEDEGREDGDYENGELGEEEDWDEGAEAGEFDFDDFEGGIDFEDTSIFEDVMDMEGVLGDMGDLMGDMGSVMDVIPL